MSEQETAALKRWIESIVDQDGAPTDGADDDGE